MPIGIMFRARHVTFAQSLLLIKVHHMTANLHLTTHCPKPSLQQPLCSSDMLTKSICMLSQHCCQGALHRYSSSCHAYTGSWLNWCSDILLPHKQVHHHQSQLGWACLLKVEHPVCLSSHHVHHVYMVSNMSQHVVHFEDNFLLLCMMTCYPTQHCHACSSTWQLTHALCPGLESAYN